MTGTVVDPGPNEDGYVSENNPPASGAAPVKEKYLLLEVPDYTGLGTSPSLSSYLCLGAASGAPTYGDDLSGLVNGFVDDDRFRGAANQPANLPPYPNSPTNETPPTVPVGQEAPVQTAPFSGGITNPSVAQFNLTPMEAESALLHLKGGWRDHSDGNRITTTRGDKIEVIQGNYKLVVLGRQPSDIQRAVGFDMSGGLLTTGDLAFEANANSDGSVNTDPAKVGSDQVALSTEYVWEANSDGNWGWTLLNTAGQHETGPGQGNGKTVSYTWADEQWSFIGSPNPQRQLIPGIPAPPYDTPTTGTVMPDEWQSGSAPRAVKKICSKTWGETILDEIHATQAPPGPGSPPPASPTPTLVINSISDGTLNVLNSSKGNLQSVTQATNGDLSSTLHAQGTLTNALTASGAIHNVTTSSDTLDEHITAQGAHNILDMCLGMRSEIDLAIAMISEIKAAILIPEIKVGIHLDTHVGIHADYHYGLHLENHIGFHLQERMIGAASSEVYIQTHATGQWLGALIGLGAGPALPDPAPPAGTAPAGGAAATVQGFATTGEVMPGWVQGLITGSIAVGHGVGSVAGTAVIGGTAVVESSEEDSSSDDEVGTDSSNDPDGGGPDNSGGSNDGGWEPL